MTLPESKIPLYKRRCSNWLESFSDWVEPRTDSPSSYIFWSGIFCIAAALRRKVFISKKTLGAWDCYPFLYIMLVGPPAMRKTTAARQGGDLMDEIPSMPQGPTMTTMPGLTDILIQSPDSSTTLVVEEFGDLILKGGLDMYEFLTSIYDGKKKLTQMTLARKGELAEAPCINLLAATTPKWIAEKMPEAIIGGGLGSRIVWVYADKLRDSRMYPKRENRWINFDAMRDDLISDLQHIEENLVGEVTIPDDVQDWVEIWHNEFYIPQLQKLPEKLKHNYGRKPVQLHKLAMIIHFARKDTMELELQDFKDALIILEKLEEHLPRIFAGVGKNPYTLDTRAIVEYIRDSGRLERKSILREFESVAPSNILEQLLQGLVSAGSLELTIEGKGVDTKLIYSIPEDE